MNSSSRRTGGKGAGLRLPTTLPLLSKKRSRSGGDEATPPTQPTKLVQPASATRLTRQASLTLQLQPDAFADLAANVRSLQRPRCCGRTF